MDAADVCGLRRALQHDNRLRCDFCGFLDAADSAAVAAFRRQLIHEALDYLRLQTCVREIEQLLAQELSAAEGAAAGRNLERAQNRLAALRAYADFLGIAERLNQLLKRPAFHWLLVRVLILTICTDEVLRHAFTVAP